MWLSGRAPAEHTEGAGSIPSTGKIWITESGNSNLSVSDQFYEVGKVASPTGTTGKWLAKKSSTAKKYLKQFLFLACCWKSVKQGLVQRNRSSVGRPYHRSLVQFPATAKWCGNPKTIDSSFCAFPHYREARPEGMREGVSRQSHFSLCSFSHLNTEGKSGSSGTSLWL